MKKWVGKVVATRSGRLGTLKSWVKVKGVWCALLNDDIEPYTDSEQPYVKLVEQETAY